MDRDDAALTDALGQNEFQMRLAQDMGLVCVPDLGWRRVLIQWKHVRGLHRPRFQGDPVSSSVLGLWDSPTLRRTLPVVLELDQVVPFASS